MAVDLGEQVDQYGRTILLEGDLEALANPERDGFILSSSTAGARVWIPHVRTAPIVFDGSGSAVAVGTKRYWTAPTGGTITGWSITAVGSSPTFTLDIWKIDEGTLLPTVANTIMGTKPALATGNARRSQTLTSWTTTINAGDILGFNIDACSAATWINFTLELE